ncbi:hypothetical protein LTR72_002148 [Exophiala xenobiotica]|nr:hypothetical protein LTR72_002148 [Exophiala xenobiotica]KAK5262536.1 hypothetical protein LTR40_000042 [Exophiala xenobiotica]KAK5315050.1 hypothetical protein LTR93_010052 [Exophiala xenobiotica]KAK5487324.1 hypothetical protein LTR55_004695 [Exophiala xenobiotica]
MFEEGKQCYAHLAEAHDGMIGELDPEEEQRVENEMEINGFAIYAVPIRSDHDRKELTNRIEHTARQAVSLHILNQPDFSISELIQYLAAVKRQDQGVPALNIQALRDFSNQPQRRPDIHVGKTGHLIQRYDHHEVDRVNKQHERSMRLLGKGHSMGCTSYNVA